MRTRADGDRQPIPAPSLAHVPRNPRLAPAPLLALPALLALCVLLALFAVLSAGRADGRPVRPLLVSAASSLQDVLRNVAAAYERGGRDVEIEVQSGSSGMLAVQIMRGAPVDLFVSADEETAIDLAGRGKLEIPLSVLARNRVVLVAPAGRPVPIDRYQDLLGPRVRRFALPDTTVPIGRYGQRFLRATGLEASLEERRIRTENVRASLAAAETGAVDLAFVYATDARLSDRVRVVAEIPDSLTGPVRIVAGVVSGSVLSAAARDFLRFLLSEEGQKEFRRAGFSSAAPARAETAPR
ncbi:MAG: molybdate ABC transporter substrate-binding protein [Candidatus Eisenbacteria bacterium]|nr:molybdate ABC transporter substrate-binding protein [Candidatus Eisenbacteria bacterium]